MKIARKNVIIYTLKTWLLLISYRIPKKFFMFSHKTAKLQFGQSVSLQTRSKYINYNRFQSVEEFYTGTNFDKYCICSFYSPFNSLFFVNLLDRIDPTNQGHILVTEPFSVIVILKVNSNQRSNIQVFLWYYKIIY